MDLMLSFPNILCLLLVGVLVAHMVTREPIVGNFHELPDHLEVKYCKVPQSYSVEDTRQCSSTQRLFLLLGNGCTLDKKWTRQEEMLTVEDMGETSAVEENSQEDVVVTVEFVEEKVPEKRKAEPKWETSAFLMESFVVSVLVCSVVASVVECYKTATRKDNGRDSPADRRFSLVDLTVNRHIRRKESQDAELFRPSCFSTGFKPPPLLRRKSFPAHIPEMRSRYAPQRQQSTPGMMPSTRRMSVDFGDDEFSLERRRVRMIRRR